MKKSDIKENCLGSGTHFPWTDTSEPRRCPVCDRMIKLTAGGKLRPHKASSNG